MTILRKLLLIVLAGALSSLPLCQGNFPLNPLAYTCPQYSECSDCPDDWQYRQVNMNYRGNLISEDRCDVTFTWNYDYIEGNKNPLLVFLCTYSDNSESCNAGFEDQCASCQNFTIYDITPSRSPSVEYTDSCGYSDHFSEIANSCSETPTTTPEVTTTTTEAPTTTAEEPTTTEEVLTTTEEVLTTTPDLGSCPGSLQCSGCPGDWGTPNFTLEGTPTPADLCDVEISWTYHGIIDMLDNPSLVFICIYEETAQYCTDASITTCGTCQSVTFHGLDPTLRPYIDYSDTCSNIDQFVVAEDCSTSTIAPTICPKPTECSGCPSDWLYPSFLIKEIPSSGDLCTVDITWEYDYDIDQEANPSLDFTCIYSENGEYCGDSPTFTCGSCQNVIFYDVDPSLNPYVDYTDTCGNIDQFPIAENCASNTPSPPYCPGPLECLGCPVDWGVPNFIVQGTLNDEDLCDVEISWDYVYSPGQSANPSLNFLCIYESNGTYCPNSTILTCGSCNMVTYYNLDPSLSPYIDYGDTCSNVDQLRIGSDCSLATPTAPPTTETILTTDIVLTTTESPILTTTAEVLTTTEPSSSGYCPDYHLCNGCPEGYNSPTLTQSGELIGNDNCTLEFTWNYPYATDIDADIVFMAFVCVYTNFEQCEPLNEDVCASCEKFVIHNIQPSRSPIIHFSDTCGFIYDIEITECS